MSFPIAHKIWSKKLIPAFIIGLILLGLGGYGLWQWINIPVDQQVDDTVWLIALRLFRAALPLTAFIVLSIMLAKRIGQSLAAMGFQFRIDQLQKRLNAQDDFFRAVNDHTPSGVTIFNNDNEYWFVNAAAARNLGNDGHNIMGRKPTSMMGNEPGRKVERNLAQVRSSGLPLEVLVQDTDKTGQARYLQTSYQQLTAFGEFPGGVMAREENVTNIIVERERRENMLRQVISTLVAVVDRRDPYATGHSARVGKLARALAIELQLTEREIDTAEIAGSLMNFGKVLVSRSILTKTEALTHDELQRIRDGILTSADILSLIDFSTPVVPTLRQVLERYDGTGVPNALKGEAILVTARIVAVANAFVAMVSPRAYRPGIEFSEAARRLASDVNRAFDPRVITVLEIFLGKNSGRVEWLSVTKS